jgi:glycine oxidase
VPTSLPRSCDTLIIGGGVVGLSLAYELSRRGATAVVVDRQAPGREASWAGAGILPPGSWYDDRPGVAELASLSAKLNGLWARDLAHQTGIDNEFRITGALYVADSEPQLARLTRKFEAWSRLGIETTRLTGEQVPDFEAQLDATDSVATFYVPGEGQIDNRLHLAALLGACQARDVVVVSPAEVVSLKQANDRVGEVVTSAGSIHVGRVVLTAGAWSGGLGELFGVRLAVRPMRGQMIDFGPLHPALLNGNIHCADRYVVPRRDGRLIVGSTVDDVGFNRDTVSEQLVDLAGFARRLLPALVKVPVSNAWSGLRPASGDGLPYIGAVPHLQNAFVATGHFRAGLQLASGTASALADVMTDETPAIDLQPFRIDR